MAAVDDFDEVLERFKLAGNEFMKGDPELVQELFSHREDVSLANPFGPPVRGWERVARLVLIGSGIGYPRATAQLMGRGEDAANEAY